MSHSRKRFVPKEVERGERVNLRKHDGIPSLTNSAIPSILKLSTYDLPGPEDIKENKMLSNLPRRSQFSEHSKQTLILHADKWREQ